MHTPGPWSVHKYNQRAVVAGDDFVVADVVNWRDTDDARLIAAAPDLLGALKDAVLQIEYLHDKFKHTSSGEAAIVRAQIAIAKAEGK